MGSWDSTGEKYATPRRWVIRSPLPNGAFDTIAELAANRCGTAMAIVNITDGNGEGPAAVFDTIAKHAVSTSIFVRPGAMSHWSDTDFLTDAEAAMARSVPFYAAVPIAPGGGRRLGTIAVVDDSEREIDARTIADLKLMARLISDTMELRMSARAEIEALG